MKSERTHRGFCCVQVRSPSVDFVLDCPQPPQAKRKSRQLRKSSDPRLQTRWSVQGEEADCLSSRDTCNSLSCTAVPPESSHYCVVYSYEQLAEHGRLAENSIICLLSSEYSANNHCCICFICSFLASCCNSHYQELTTTGQKGQPKPNPTVLQQCKIQKIPGLLFHGALAVLLMFTTCVVFFIYLLFIQLQPLAIALSP